MKIQLAKEFLLLSLTHWLIKRLIVVDVIVVGNNV